MIAIIDYGVGNLFSLSHSLSSVGASPVITADAEIIRSADHVILPGVGAFGDAADRLRETGLDAMVKEAAARGTPIMGICLGMQLLMEKSFEFGEHAGLGLIPGAVKPISDVIPAGLKIPHIGWNALYPCCWHRYGLPDEKGISLRINPPLPHPVFEDVASGECVYFVHSYYAACGDDCLLATTEYGAPLTAAIGRNNVVGCQFHPEKSGDVGLRILKAFCRWNGRDGI